MAQVPNKPKPTLAAKPTTATTSASREARPHSFQSRLARAQRPDYYHCLFFGPSRVGKTTLIGTAGAYEPSSPHLMLDFEGGASSVMGLEGVTVVQMRDWDDFSEAYDYLLKAQHGFKSVSVDSISELHVFSLLDIIEKEAKGNSRRTDDTAEIQDYGKAMIMLRRFLRHMRALPMHVFVTALTKEDSFPNEGKVRVPAMFGQLAGETVGMFPVVAYLANEIVREGNGKRVQNRRLYLQNQPNIRIGVRVPFGSALPDVLDNPTIGSLFTLLDKIYS